MADEKVHLFGEYDLDPARESLLRAGRPVHLRQQAYRALKYLAENRGRLVSKERLIEEVWEGRAVTDDSLVKCLRDVRQALGEGGERYLRTERGRGYIFEVEAGGLGTAAEGGAWAEQVDLLRVVVEEEEEEAPTGPVIANRWQGQDVGQQPERLPPSPPPSTRRRKLVALGAAVASLAVVVTGLYYLFSRTTKEPLPPSMKVIPFTSFPGREDHAAFSPDGNQIAFAWGGEKSDNPDIYVKSVGGESPLRLTSDPAIDIRPAWSPDGQTIAFVRIIPAEPSFTIYVVSALGTSPERKLLSLTRGPSTVAWSPDGKFIAISDAPSSQEHPGIVLFSPETGEKRTLTSPPAQFWADSHPAFSPDGQALAFIRENTAVTGDVYVVPITGGEPRRVTYDNAKHVFNSGVVGGLAWAADGLGIIFSSTRGGIPGLWRVAVSGGDPERLAVGGDNTYYPTISRQGHRLAYTQLVSGTPVYRIGVPNSTAHRGLATRLITSTQTDASPQYSPDGRSIVFESNRSGNREIWVCDSEGQNPSRLTSFGRGSAVNPRWSPDGKQIAFDYRAVGAADADVYLLSIEGGVPRRITTEASDDGLPSWSKDGRWIYFASNRGGDEQVWKVLAEGGEAAQVTRQGGSTTFESADGKYIYYSKGSIASGVWRVPVEGGEEVLVLDQPGAGVWGSWALADDGIYFINGNSKGGPAVEFFSFDRHEIRWIVGLARLCTFNASDKPLESGDCNHLARFLHSRRPMPTFQN